MNQKSQKGFFIEHVWNCFMICSCHVTNGWLYMNLYDVFVKISVLNVCLVSALVVSGVHPASSDSAMMYHVPKRTTTSRWQFQAI